MFGLKQAPKTVTVQEESAPEKHGLPTPDPNGCLEVLNGLLTQTRAKGAVAKLYLENFKAINDAFGHDFGEQMLERIYDFLEQLEQVQVLRYGGVEFLLVMDRVGHSAVANLLTQVCERFEQVWRIGNMDYMCSISMGVIFYPDRVADGTELLRALEYAVTEASQKGENQYVVYDSTIQQKIQQRRSIAHQFLYFEKSPQMLEIRYRPTYCREEMRFTRAECYLRLLSPDYGPIPAQAFIPVAEDSGIICVLNRYVIEEVCKGIQHLMEQGLEFESIAVPISPVQFLQEQFVEEIRGLLERYQIPPQKLAFEVSENVLINSLSIVNVVMQDLAELGVELILNDFGSGYSGISNILDLPIDVVKLERLFVWQLETNPRSGVLIEGLIQMAEKLGLKLIAEGVETDHQLGLLQEYGCHYLQGFYYAPTLPFEDLEKVLRNPNAVSELR